MRIKYRTAHGFTLAELLIFIIITGIAVAAIAGLFAKNVGSSADPYLRQKALAVAKSYMDEIIRQRWNHNTPFGGGCVKTGSGQCEALEPSNPSVAPIGNEGQARVDYDDIDDYDGLDEAPKDSLGALVDGYSGFNVQVQVTEPAGNWNGVPAADVRKIVVTVATPNNENISLTSYRLNF
jgi:MSHA pilin protein MshD